MSVQKIAQRSLTVGRAGVAGAAAVVLLAACGGGGGDSTASSATSTADSSATDAGGADTADFCAQAGNIDEKVNGVLDDLGGGSSVPDAIHSAADELRAIEAPQAISTQWTALVDGLDQIADALADFDITDGESVAAVAEIEGRLTAASNKVENYLQDECGIN